MKAGKDLVGKQFLALTHWGSTFYVSTSPDQTKNGVIGVLVIPFLGERINDLMNTASAKEVAANVLADKTVDTV